MYGRKWEAQSRRPYLDSGADSRDALRAKSALSSRSFVRHHLLPWRFRCLEYIDCLKTLGIFDVNLVQACSSVSNLYQEFGRHAHPLVIRPACLEPNCGFEEHHGAFYYEAVRWAREAWKWHCKCSSDNHTDVVLLQKRSNRLEGLRAACPFSPVQVVVSFCKGESKTSNLGS
ncbi:hypothetical protein EJ03DRAFT_139128 [Teratosphaeria nubilosa]|uniref:Uncharacterized protein n=1 Tax=Teratosphaeria nubilosa TaxID=161662 RepID=A0A6G1L6L5_9PEZI|nr:hypothetical protein EJ03DRAFT_139128 [Teratosphaeria nubilosa]